MSDFHITQETATDMAQMAHNAIDQNGEIDEDKVIEVVSESLGEELENWLRDNINWQKILDDDESVREFAEERDQALNEIRAEALEGARYE